MGNNERMNYRYFHDEINTVNTRLNPETNHFCYQRFTAIDENITFSFDRYTEKMNEVFRLFRCNVYLVCSNSPLNGSIRFQYFIINGFSFYNFMSSFMDAVLLHNRSAFGSRSYICVSWVIFLICLASDIFAFDLSGFFTIFCNSLLHCFSPRYSLSWEIKNVYCNSTQIWR